MIDRISSATRRAQSYRYIDGTYELHLGLTLLILATISIIPAEPVGWNLEGILFFILPIILLVGGGWVIDRIVQIIKVRVTFRRSGYVSYPTKKEPLYSPDMRVLFVTLGFLACVILLAFAGEFLTEKWMAILPGLTFSVVIGITAVQAGLRRYYYLAAGSLLLGIVSGLVNDGTGNMLAVYFGLMGLILLGCGVLILRNYLRKHPAPVEGLDEH